MTDSTPSNSGAPATPAPAAPAAPASQPGAQSGAQPTPAGWSAEKIAAHQELAQVRTQVLEKNGSTNVAAKLRFNELSRFLYEGGPTPKNIGAPKHGADPHAPSQAIPGGFSHDDPVQGFYDPAGSPSDYHVRGKFEGEGEHAAVPGMQESLQDVLFSMKLPARDGTLIADRVLAHRRSSAEGGDGGSTYLEAHEVAEFREEAERQLANFGTYQELDRIASEYIRQTMSPADIEKLKGLLTRNGKVSSVLYDPQILLRLAAVARARGIK